MKRIKLNEATLHNIIHESVKNVLNEIGFDTAKNAYKKSYDRDIQYMLDNRGKRNPKYQRQTDNLYQHMKHRASEKFDPNMDVIVVGDKMSGRYKAGELDKYFQLEEPVEPSRNPIYGDSKIIGYPRLKGYAGPMWDGDKIRYETWDVYDGLSR